MTEAAQSFRIQLASILILLLLCLLVAKFTPFKGNHEKTRGRSVHHRWETAGSAAASHIEDLYFNEMRPLESTIKELCLKNRNKNSKRYDKLCSSMIKRLLAWKREINRIARAVRDDARGISINDGRNRKGRKRRSVDSLAEAEEFEPAVEVHENEEVQSSETTASSIGQQQATVDARNRMLVERILSKMDSDQILKQLREKKLYNSESQCDYDLLRSATMGEFIKMCSEEFSRYNISAQLVDDHLLVCGLSDDGGRNFTTTKYKPRKWTSQLEKDLTQDTNNFFKSQAMALAYEKYIRPITQIKRYESLDRNFRWFMHRYNIYFGNKHHSILRPMSLYSEFFPFQNYSVFQNALENFERELSASFPEVPKYNDTSGKLKVAIITGPYGAGHTSTAAALTKAFQESPDFDVIKVDECTDFPDTLFIATCGRYHSCKIYNDVIVRDNDFEKAEFLSMLNLMLTDYIPQNKFGKLNERLRQERPDLIISTVHHIPEITENSFLLNRPLRIMVTDYEFPQKQWHSLNHVPADLVKYWIPSTNRNLFRPMVHEYLKQSWEGRHPKSRTQTINETLFMKNLPMESTFEELGALELLPFPVASAIVPPKDWNDVIESRRKLVLTESPDRKVISVAQGGTPNTQMMTERIMQLINDSQLITGKFQIAVVTSGIQPLIDRVTEMFRFNNISIMTEKNKKELENSNDKIIARVFQRLQYPIDMAELYKASDLLISKSGGATSAEVIASATKFVNGFPLWDWEIENTKHLESLGLTPDISERRQNNTKVNAIPNRKVYTLPPTSPIMVKRINAMLTIPRFYQSPAKCFRNEDARRAAAEAVRASEVSRRNFAEDEKLKELDRDKLQLIDLNDPRELLRKLSSSFITVNSRLFSFMQ